MSDIRDQINAQLYGVGEADLHVRHAQLHSQLLQNAAFMGGTTSFRRYGKERRTMFRFLRRLIEKALGIKDLRERLDAAVRAQTQADRESGELTTRLRRLEIAEMRRTVQAGWVAVWLNPEDKRRHPLDIHWPGPGVILDVHPNGLLLENGTFVPWSWVETVRGRRPEEMAQPQGPAAGRKEV